MKFTLTFICVFNLVLLMSVASATETELGEKLYREHCASCHAFGRILTGPDLTNINELRTEEWLILFIRDSKLLIESGDVVANEIYRQYKFTEMPPFELSDEDIKAILLYIENYSEGIIAEQKVKTTVKAEPEIIKTKKIPTYLLFLGIIMLIFLAWLLLVYPSQRFSSLNSFLVKLVSPAFYVFMIILILSIGLIMAANHYISRKLTIIPFRIEQHVQFSHDLHYNTYDIDCIYCHIKAKDHKTANIPNAAHCMKCHEYILEGDETGSTEIDKLLEIYNNKHQLIWQSGYRLSEYSRFDHSLHRQTECTDCHQNTADTRIIKTAVSMKWCIDCHRQEYIAKDNDYYKKLYDTLLSIRPISLEFAGSIDCNRCHY